MKNRFTTLFFASFVLCSSGWTQDQIPIPETSAAVGGTAPAAVCIKSLSLKDVLTIADMQSRDILQGLWDKKERLLDFKAESSSGLPRADISSGLSYVNDRSVDKLDDLFASHLSVYTDILDAWKLFSGKAKKARFLESERFYDAQTKNKSKSTAIALYYEYWSCNDRLAVDFLAKELASFKRRQAEYAYGQGLLSRKEMEAADSEMRHAEWRYESAKTSAGQAAQKLIDYLLLPSSLDILPPPEMPLPQIPELKQIIDNSVRNSQDLILSSMQLEEASADLKSMTLKRWTDFYTTSYAGNYTRLDQGFSSSRLDDFYYGADVTWQVPIFDGGDFKRQKEFMELNYEKMSFEHRLLPAQIMEKTVQMWNSLLEIKKEEEQARRICENKEKEWSLANIKYQKGDISAFEKMAAQWEMETARTDMRLRRYEYIVAYANLNYFCGAGTGWIET